jgi:hypothetical protein
MLLEAFELHKVKHSFAFLRARGGIYASDLKRQLDIFLHAAPIIECCLLKHHAIVAFGARLAG